MRSLMCMVAAMASVLGMLGCGATAGALNECGGRQALAAKPGQPCETGTWACDGLDSVRCSDCTSGMCVVPAREFVMGCTAADCRHFTGPRGQRSSDLFRLAYESPKHAVSLAAFEIDQREVTVRDYQACASCTAPSTHDRRCNWGVAGREDHPVNCVTWLQARQYCAAGGKRLCTEAEWEHAARGTDGRTFPWGNEAATCARAVFDEAGLEPLSNFEPEGDGCGTGTTMPVGSKPAGASPSGALDMAGNVDEWLADDWHRTYEGAPPDGRPWCGRAGDCAGERGYSRVIRGGNFSFGAEHLRSSSRRWAYPDSLFGDSFDIGIRCCR